MGFVAYHTGGWEWIYWTYTIINGIQFVLYFFLGPETLYVRNAPKPRNNKSAFQREFMTFGKIGPRPLKMIDFLTPIKLLAYPNILIPTISYTIVFGFASVLLTLEIPQIFQPRFHFNSQQTGLQFLGMIVGSILGEIVGGKGSDIWMRRGAAKLGRSRRAQPEYRLWLSYGAFICVLVGLIVFCVQIEKIKAYNVTPIIGIGIAAFGNQIITTVLVTYAVDSHHEHAASIGVFVNVIRNGWGFIGPFWYPDMFNDIGLYGSAGVMIGLVVVVGILPIVFIQFRGAKIREKRAENELDQVNTITR